MQSVRHKRANLTVSCSIKSKAARVGGLAARNKVLKLKEYGDLHAGYSTSVLQMTYVFIVKVLISSLITVWACTDTVMIQKKHGGVALSYIHSTCTLMLGYPMFYSLNL